MMLTDSYGITPGMTTSRESYENEFRWGMHQQGVYANGLIDGNSLDLGNTPTTELRAGLILGSVLATGKYKTYNPTGTDGTEVASAVLLETLTMVNFAGVGTDRFYAVLVGGPVQAAKLVNLDRHARQQMDKFSFDDSSEFGSIVGSHWYPWKRFVNKTANYTILSTDNFTMFDNAGAGAQVVLTLPTLANGYFFGLHAEAAQTFKFTSAEGGNVVGTTATQSSVSVAAIGGVIYIYSNPGATKWIVEQHGTQTITAA
jgi:hypothetical protein